MKLKTKICSRCERELPIERFSGIVRKDGWCKNCQSSYASIMKGTLNKDNIVRIERIYKELLAERILDVKLTGISLVNSDEVFFRLIDYRDAWASNYGRVLEYKNNRYRFKRLSENETGEKVCMLSKNVHNGKKWVWKKQTVEVWRLVVGVFIVNFDIVGNTHCWHKNNNKADNYYKNIYPMNEKQYDAVLEKYNAGVEITDELITDIVNDIFYKADDWYANKWKRTMFGVGYLGCNDANIENDNYIYSKWCNMMQRCYDANTHKLKPYYADCTVDIEWHNFSNYRAWHKENQMGDQRLDLDKDVLIQGNMEYGAETCTLIPHFTNTIFEERGADTNITLNADSGKYDVVMSILGKKNEVGSFDTEEEARAGFIAYKQDYIRKVAEDCKGKLPNKTYEAMKNWTVELADFSSRKAAAQLMKGVLSRNT